MTPSASHSDKWTDSPVLLSTILFAFGLTMLGLLALVGVAVVG